MTLDQKIETHEKDSYTAGHVVREPGPTDNLVLIVLEELRTGGPGNAVDVAVRLQYTAKLMVSSSQVEGVLVRLETHKDPPVVFRDDRYHLTEEQAR